MQFTLTITCDNAAFDGETIRNYELRRILDKVGVDIAHGKLAVGDELPVTDVNGNLVGVATLAESDQEPQ